MLYITRYLFESTNYFNSSNLFKIGNFIDHESISNMPKNISIAHELYGSEKCVYICVYLGKKKLPPKKYYCY